MRLFFFLLLTGLVGAQPLRLELEVTPSDAQVFLTVPGVEPVALGRADSVLLVEPRPGAGLLLRREGWKEARMPLPPEGPVRLEPAPGFSAWLSRLDTGRAALMALVGLAAVFLFKRRPVAPEPVLEGPPGPLSLEEVGGYRLLELLGSGSTASVYRGVPLKPGEAVAVKILDPALARDPRYRKRWKREAAICSELSHPNLVRLLAWGEEGERLYMVTELLEGEPVRGPLPWKEAVELAATVLEALEEAHRQGVVHRDVKPENLMRTAAGQVKVLDFGVARGEDFTVATETGVALGSPAYMAPEQIQGQVVPSSDQYSMGIVLYELLTGAPPFEADDPLEWRLLHSGRKARPPSEKVEGLPPELDAAVLKMLAKTPKRRFPSAADAAAALRATLPASPSPEP